MFRFSEIVQTPETKRKIPATSTSSQTTPSLDANQKITAEDLISDTPSERYWEALAEKRRIALEETLNENQELYERIATLENEVKESKAMLAEARSLVEVMTELLEESDNAPKPAETATTDPDEGGDKHGDEDTSGD